ncbi:MAG: hypothetical protein M1823_008318, partial [Watsoniomyces obsoletus]
NPVSRQRTPLNAARGSMPQPQPSYRAVPPQQDPNSLGWSTNTPSRPRAGQQHQHPKQDQQQHPHVHAPQSRNGLQMLSDAAMGPTTMQSPAPQHWVPQQGQQMVGAMPPGMTGDPNMGLAPYGMDPVDMGNMQNVMDLDLMAYGFGDEFMAMGFGMAAVVKQAADAQGIEIRYYNIIYDLVDD